MIMRLWVGNDVNPSCLLHSPPPAYQILNTDLQKAEVSRWLRLTLLEIFPSKLKMGSRGPTAGTVACFTVYVVHAETLPGEDGGGVRSLLRESAWAHREP